MNQKRKNVPGIKIFSPFQEVRREKKGWQGSEKKQDAAFASIIDERTGMGDKCVSESLQRGKGRKLV